MSPPTGQFKKYTPFQVSLFTVSHSSKVLHLSSVTGYSLQGSKYLCIVLGPSFQKVFYFFWLILTSSPLIKWKMNLESSCPSCPNLNHFSAPSRVPSFKVISIAATDVTLLWEPVPLPKQRGVILYYQIGVDKHHGKHQQHIIQCK